MKNPPNTIESAISILREVQRRITQNPESFDMNYWDCGTTQCIAGHVAAIMGHELCGVCETAGGKSIPDVAREALGLSKSHYYSLFLWELWPYPYLEDYRKASTARGRAVVASAFIDHYISSGELEDGRTR